MKFIFFGTPDFAKIILEKLVKANFIPVTIVTNPDRPVGRKKVLTSPPVKSLIVKCQMSNVKCSAEVLQPENLSAISHMLRAIRPEFGILAAYGKIIPKEIIDIFSRGIIVVHPSLLPKYRGATPIQSAILAGEKETGTTLIVMDEKVDHGPILANSKWQIANSDDYETLSKKLAELSGNLLIETLPKYLNGEIKPQAQNHSQATYTKKLTTADGFINYDDLIRSCHPDEPLGEEGSRGEASLRAAESGEAISTTNIRKIASPRPALRSEARDDNARSIWLKIRALNPEPGVWTILNSEQSSLLCDRTRAKKNSPSATPQSGVAAEERRMKILAADLINGKLVLRKIQFEGERPKEVF